MDKIVYTQEKMDAVKTQVQKLVEIVAELEAEFPGRHFRGIQGRCNGWSAGRKYRRSDGCILLWN